MNPIWKPSQNTDKHLTASINDSLKESTIKTSPNGVFSMLDIAVKLVFYSYMSILIKLNCYIIISLIMCTQTQLLAYNFDDI